MLVSLSHFRNEGEDYLGEFVRLLWTALVRRQAEEAILLESDSA